MKRILLLLTALIAVLAVEGAMFSYRFVSVPLPKAIQKIIGEHPSVDINFIYDELENYRTSATVNADNAYDALRQLVGLNPVTVTKSKGTYYIEALQRGKYVYSGRAVGSDGVPVEAATVMLLAPKDSTVLTYGVTDGEGRFSIPCDMRGVIAKLTCVGYRTTWRHADSFNFGTIAMPERVITLGHVTVDGAGSLLYPDKSVYMPSAKQKRAAQTARDLIIRMGIPQLKVGDGTKTAIGRSVDYFIDFMPATSGELEGMRMEDVKRVEYYDYPSDPRFQGKAHVINFIMQKYEYGGYVKGVYYDNFVISRQFNGYAKTQYRRMTFDWAGGVYYSSDRKNYENTVETFRLPQTDGTVCEFERTSEVSGNRKLNHSCWTSVKALYATDRMAISNMATVDFDRTPEHVTDGTVIYSDQETTVSAGYGKRKSSRVNSFVYNGNYHFYLPHGDYLTFDPYYAYTHTNQHSSYGEAGMEKIPNGAYDDSHEVNGAFSYVHSFGSRGTLKASLEADMVHNMTRYSGSSTISDKAKTSRLGPTLTYSYAGGKFYGTLELGMLWDKSKYGGVEESSAAPRVNLSAQYAFNNRNSLSVDFNYGKSIPATGYRSAAIVQEYPLMRYTGNPSVVPYDFFITDADYTWIPNNLFSLSAFGSAWIVDHRYVYDYEADSAGILRTVKQPAGKYAQWKYGLNGSVTLFDGNLQLGASCSMYQAYNGQPYNWMKSSFDVSISAYYYLDNVYFGAVYNTPGGYADGCMVGIWRMERDSYTFQVGWSNRNWNLRFFTRNFLRYGTYQTKSVMRSKYYDALSYVYKGSYSGFFQFSATCTFGYGKKVSPSNEAYKAGGASSGILK